MFINIRPFFIFHIATNTKHIEDEAPVLTRSYTEANVDKFKSEIGKINWDSVTKERDVQSAYSAFYLLISRLYNECFPLKPLRKKYFNRKPWLMHALKTAIKLKNKLYINRFKGGNFEENDRHYKQFRNRLGHKLRVAERNYYKEQINIHKGNMRKTWAVIKEVVNKSKYRAVCKKFKHNGKIVEDSVEIANGFNDFFCKCGFKLGKKDTKVIEKSVHVYE